MKFLKRLFQHSRLLWHKVSRFFSGNKATKKIIPDFIDKEEMLVRGIFYPIHFKKSRISDVAFLPRSGENDVSVLRRNYTTDNFCKSFFAGMPSKMTYKGLFVLLAKHISEIAEKCGIKDKVTIMASPLDIHKKEIQIRPILDSFPGLPMHADIHYYDKFEKGEVQTRYREFARELVNRVNKYFEDSNITSPNWHGPDLEKAFLETKIAEK